MKFEKDMGIEEIKIINNFISQEEADLLISYINNNVDVFNVDYTTGGKRQRLLFGKDSYDNSRSEATLEKIKDIEPFIRKKIFPKVEKTIKKAYSNKKNLMVASFFLVKQYKGATVPEHIDTDGASNMQFKYGGVIYLNDMEANGKLRFSEFNYEYLPKACDLIIFPSKPYQYRHSVDEINEDRYSLPIWLTEYPFWKL
jgi:hypothetical protein